MVVTCDIYHITNVLLLVGLLNHDPYYYFCATKVINFPH